MINKKKYDRDWYAKQTPEWKKRKVNLQRNRVQRIKKAVYSYKHVKGCHTCSEDDPVCLDFHHTTDDKEINIGDAIRNGWSLDRIMKEVKKCEVLCSNCHRKLHAKLTSV